jgi:hypothetical protein
MIGKKIRIPLMGVGNSIKRNISSACKETRQRRQMKKISNRVNSRKFTSTCSPNKNNISICAYSFRLLIFCVSWVVIWALFIGKENFLLQYIISKYVYRTELSLVVIIFFFVAPILLMYVLHLPHDAPSFWTCSKVFLFPTIKLNIDLFGHNLQKTFRSTGNN